MGFRLRIVAGPGLGTELALEDLEVTVGRAPENGIVINDNNVSRVHARFSVASGRVIVADAGSRNGVFVNDRKVAEQPITPGDRVVIGQTVLELLADRAAAPVRAPAARPVSSGSPAARPAGRGAVVPVRKGAVANKGRAPAKSGGWNVLAGLGLVAVIGAFAAAAVIRGNSGKDTRPGGTGTRPASTAQVTRTPPAMPGFTELPSGPQKLSKAVQQWLDVGDSNRISGNLPKARDAYRNALKVEPNCYSCDVRLHAVNSEIDAKVAEYVRGGELLFESGNYEGAVARWKIAQEFIGDPKDPKWIDLKNDIDKAAQLVRKQPQ